uniref:Uncharacterized protein n=1 Tax=Anguilla anguilla TaxID=7936 RepID=A0A0E9US38_ANGAN
MDYGCFWLERPPHKTLTDFENSH